GQELKTIFNAFRINETGIFIAVRDDDLIIDQFDHNGIFLQRYKKTMSDFDFFIRDIHVSQSNNGELKFYVLSIKDGIPKITVYQAS
ncbi:MAG: hypothetical protein ACFCU6_15270, partial [Balneolaceae bacterium]